MARSRKAMTFMFLLAAVRAEAVERAMVENVEGLRAFLDPEGP